jgi:hypothetical protein
MTLNYYFISLSDQRQMMFFNKIFSSVFKKLLYFYDENIINLELSINIYNFID